MIVTVRIFNSSDKLVTQEDKKRIAPRLYKQGWKDSKYHQTCPLKDLPSIEQITLVIPLNLTIVDFDTNKSFIDAQNLNSALPENLQCKFIVKSDRKGGHFYYKQSKDIEISPLHSQKEVTTLDILEGPGHNAFAPTQGDPSKHIVCCKPPLTPMPKAMEYYINSIILSQASPSARKEYIVSKTPHSDNNYYMLEQYVVNSLNPQLFYNFYQIPAEMPAGTSWKTLQALTYRLLKDETVTHKLLMQVLDKYDPEYRQDHNTLAPEEENVYIEARKQFSFTALHRHTQTPLSVYLDIDTGEYIIDHTTKPLILPTETKMKIMMESLTGIKRSQIKTTSIEAVTTVSTYDKVGGLDLETKIFNYSYMNNYLKAFKGTKPTSYRTPQKLIDLTRLMWGDEWEYMLASTQFRYQTFRHSPVVTHIVGTEGSGKDLTVHIVTAGFNEDVQEVDYTLFMDKHSNHQIMPNTVLEEVGDWNVAEQKGALSKIKSLSGSNGKVTVRGMQRTATVKHTINKIWVLGNSWMKLHNDPITQRRIHAVYMPQSLKVEAGGPYTSEDIEEALTELLDFYYWLGNIYRPSIPFTQTEYMSAICRQESKSYSYYIDSVEGNGDRIIRYLMKRKYPALLRALTLVNATEDNLVMKYSRNGPLVVTLKSLKKVFQREPDSNHIARALDTIVANIEGEKRLSFDSSPEKYITFFDAPNNLNSEKLQLKE